MLEIKIDVQSISSDPNLLLKHLRLDLKKFSSVKYLK